MARSISARIYDLYGRFYDASEFIFKRRLKLALQNMPFAPGQTILDIGVGTGLSLGFYPRYVKIVGLDLSAGMLAQAQKKLDDPAHRPACAVKLLQGNALNLPFPNNRFDGIFMSHVISTVPDPAHCLAEALRVACDGAVLTMVNHFRSEIPIFSLMETAVDPLCRRLGWRSDLSLPELLNEVGVENIHSIRPSLFQIVYLQKQGSKVLMLRTEEIQTSTQTQGRVAIDS